MDFISPFPKTSHRFTYIFHVVNYFSLYAMGYLTKDATVEVAISGLSYVFQHLPHLNEIYCNPGSHFTGYLMEAYLRQHHVKFTPRPSSFSRATGKIENVGCWAQAVIQKQLLDHSNWDLELPRAYEDLNNQVISHLWYSPVEIQFGLDASQEVVDIPSASCVLDTTTKAHSLSIQLHIQYLADLHKF